jgi:thiamine pyrophosphokinase
MPVRCGEADRRSAESLRNCQTCAAVPDTVVVLAGGEAPSPSALLSVPHDAPVVAADGGADRALALGLEIDAAVGDLDSITPAALETLEREGVRIERHPAEKDATDLELALSSALAFGPRRILVVGGAGGRLDHLLGELLLLGADDYAGVELDAVLGEAMIHVIRGERVLAGAPGELISLFALHGPAVGVVTEGLEYRLRGETLAPGSSRGLSNRFAAAEARISLARGVLLAVRPGEQA